MYLWKITRIGSDNEAVYDANWGHVVAADSWQEARKLAAREAQDEGGAVWHDPEHTTVERIGTAGSSVKRGVILSDCRHG